MLSVIKKAFPKTLPVLAGYIFLGIAYGISMKSQGFGVGWSTLASVFLFGGSMQFALIDFLGSAFAPLTIAVLTVLIQARHVFYGLSMLEKYSNIGPWKPYAIFALSDETYSLVVGGAPEGVKPGPWYAAVSALDQLYWVIGTVLGALIGELIPTHLMTGIDFAMTALFVVIVTEQTMDAVAAYRAGKMSLTNLLFSPLLGGIATLVCLLLLGSENGRFLLPAMGVMLAGFLVRYVTGGKGELA